MLDFVYAYSNIFHMIVCFFMCLSVGGYRHVVPCLDTGRIIKLESGHVEVRNYLLMEAVLCLVRENKV